MFERYTEAARRVLFRGRHEAAKCGNPFIETEHLLLGLLREEGSRAAQALREVGLELSLVREQISGLSQGTPETAYDELHRLVAGLPPEQLEAAARALRSLNARFVSPYA